MNPVIRTLIVDDSAFVRKVVKEMLCRSPFIEVVGMARDGEEALELAEKLSPDVITCDLSMPVVNGVEFVKQQMARKPLPILILSATPEDAGQVVEALDAGAVDFVRKPTAFASPDLLSVREELVEAVKIASRTHQEKVAPAIVQPAFALPAAPSNLRVDAVVIGISTGGPQALRHMLAQFPADFPVPIAIVLHMPLGYTEMFAQKLDEVSPLEVREVREGDRMRPGLVLLGQAGRHFRLHRNGSGQVECHLSAVLDGKPHCPSVDHLFQSAAETYKSRLLGVIMTGMGDDGKQGCAWVKARGGRVITESEESCVIYGMPRSVDEAGLSDLSAPLGTMTETILNNL